MPHQLFLWLEAAGKRFVSNRTQNQKQGKTKCRPSTFTDFLPTAAKGMSPSTGSNYRTAVRSFADFCGGKSIAMGAIDANMTRDYERWLSVRGVCRNTSSCYMRSLRAIYNKAVAKRLVKDRKPFERTFTGNEHTQKRSIGIGEIRRLQRHKPCRDPETAIAKDIFLFSFFAMGMSFIDVAHLKRSQLKDGTLTYRRRKTGKQVSVKLEQCMLDIISRYARSNSEWVFPILYKVKNGKMVKRSYAAALGKYNRQLKTLAEETGIGKRLTSYVSRHSWASIAYEKNVELPVISKALGHHDTKTTLIYIREIDDSRMASANKKLLENLLGPPLGKRYCGITNRVQI